MLLLLVAGWYDIVGSDGVKVVDEETLVNWVEASVVEDKDGVSDEEDAVSVDKDGT